MKLLLSSLLFLLLGVQCSHAQNASCPPNIDFETGNLDHWDCSIGSVDTVMGANVITLNSSAPDSSRHEIMDSTDGAVDSFGKFPTVCPYGGRYSVKLGNQSVGKEAEGISYTFQIPASADTFALTYYYAVVFQDPDHKPFEQPRFFVSAYDVLTGKVIDCAAYNYISNGAIPGFKISEERSNVLYKEWTPASIDFSGLAGRQVRLEFKTADCTRGAHFGYAYLDVGTSCGGVMAVGAYCIETNSVTLNAPYGFETYTWYNNNYSTVIANTRTFSLSPPPPVNSLFHVDMIPYPGYGCRDTADAKLFVLPVPDTPITKSDVGYCQYDYADALDATSYPGFELIWYSSPSGTPSTIAPIPSTSTKGVFEYWVTQKRFFGCESPRKKITVTISPTPTAGFSLPDYRLCQAGNNFAFINETSNVVDSTRYHWDFGDGNKSDDSSISHSYLNAGHYQVVLTITNPPSCIRQIAKYVDVIPKPMALYTYPPVICENQTPVVLDNNSYNNPGVSPVVSSWWKIGDNIVTDKNPTPFLAAAGQLPVKLVVANADGCHSDTNSNVLTINYKPIPRLNYISTFCDNEVTQFRNLSMLPAIFGDAVTTWNWSDNNIPSFSTEHPVTHLSAGTHHISLQVETGRGCKSTVADTSITIFPKPSIALNISDSCVFRDIVYTASNTTSVPVNKWLWNVGYGLKEGDASFTKRFTSEDFTRITLIGQTSSNCKDTIIRPFTIYYNRSRAERDTLAAMDEPVQLITSRARNMLWYKWAPAIGLSSTSEQNPVATYDKDQEYELNTMTVQGCESYSKVLIQRYKGPELYVASAFTPNADGLNDILHILPVGIKSFNYFCIYNRFGQLLFKTTDHYIGWDGRYGGVYVDAGNYIWAAKATDYKGNLLFRKGNVILLR